MHVYRDNLFHSFIFYPHKKATSFDRMTVVGKIFEM